jgi:hypothetical protein
LIKEVWIFFKLAKLLSYLGIKILDQDGDGKLDKEDVKIAAKNLSAILSKKKSNDEKAIKSK